MLKKTEQKGAGLEPDEVKSVLAEMLALRSELLAEEAQWAPRLKKVHPHYRQSARNLLHYLALRRSDRRPLQRRLTLLGLSSLGRAEAHVLATVEAVLRALHQLSKSTRPLPEAGEQAIDFLRSEALISTHAACLLGEMPKERGTRIMVTMPSEAADDPALVHSLLAQGMDCMRINCAHDQSHGWLRMITHLRQAEQALGRSCKVVMDLAGPKLRTGPIAPGPAVLRIRPRRDVYGHVTQPARVWLTAESAPHPPPAPADGCLPVPQAWLATLRAGQQVKFRDAREAKKTLTIVDSSEQGCWAVVAKTAYIVPGTRLRPCDQAGAAEGDEALVGELPCSESSLSLHPGDALILTRDHQPGRPATRDDSGALLQPAAIGTTLSEVFNDVRPGEPIWFDDGKIGGEIEQVLPDRVRVRITATRPGGEKLRSDKGINLPESRLRLSALTAKDVADLAFAARHADVVELSFANTARDVTDLQHRLAAFGDRQPAIVLKIETRRGFENLPEMLLAAMQSPCCGVMIARGDLAVECGFERLAEVQEEILWVCEAAHVPVVWATQVLESLAKEGTPSRAEITDAAMGHRAECVMLNKGPHLLTAIRVLDNILRRMQSHQAKKQSMLRALHLAHALTPETDKTD